MGLDVGDKWIGVAISDETGLLASARDPIQRVSDRAAWEQIIQIVNALNVSEIVVGLPLNLNSSLGAQAEKTLRFVNRLRVRAPCPVATWDERLTTREAERILIEQDVRRNRRRRLVDGVAAALILQGYLDHRLTAIRREETQMADDKEILGHGIPEDEDEIITLTDEDGQEHEFVVVDVIEVDRGEYAILLPIDTDESEEADAIILRLEKDADGDDVLVDIESEEEWERVAAAYEQLLDDEIEE
ncbi:MAG: Holliday junction resolvase RuvX [Thermaerobacter sp.]|nr:Holliday junction resolvase RuvX [Thermaerobacter sp.]